MKGVPGILKSSALLIEELRTGTDLVGFSRDATRDESNYSADKEMAARLLKRQLDAKRAGSRSGVSGDYRGGEGRGVVVRRVLDWYLRIINSLQQSRNRHRMSTAEKGSAGREKIYIQSSFPQPLARVRHLGIATLCAGRPQTSVCRLASIQP